MDEYRHIRTAKDDFFSAASAVFRHARVNGNGAFLLISRCLVGQRWRVLCFTTDAARQARIDQWAGSSGCGFNCCSDHWTMELKRQHECFYLAGQMQIVKQ